MKALRTASIQAAQTAWAAVSATPFDAATAVQALRTLADHMNQVEADLFLEQRAPRNLDFSNQGAVQAHLNGPLELRYGELTDMDTQLGGGIIAPATQARADATLAVNANPYNVGNAKVAIAAYITAVDQAEQTATQRMGAHVKANMLFGTEFSFTQPAIHALDTEKNDATYTKAVELIGAWKSQVELRTRTRAGTRAVPAQEKVKLEGGAARPGENGWKFTYRLPSGASWWWKLNIDYGCLETQAEPITIDKAGAGENQDAEFVKNVISQHIFESARAADLAPHATIGGGHLSLDRGTTFGDNSRYLRNFLVIYANDARKWGAEDPDAVNAPFVTELNSAGKKAFKDVIADYDQRYPGANTRMTVEQLVQVLKDRVFIKRHFTLHPENDKAKRKRDEQPAHYQSTNVEHLTSTSQQERRIEMRRFDAQTDFDDLMANMESLTELVVDSRRTGLVPLAI